jgi:hypothetical protein
MYSEQEVQEMVNNAVQEAVRNTVPKAIQENHIAVQNARLEGMESAFQSMMWDQQGDAQPMSETDRKRLWQQIADDGIQKFDLEFDDSASQFPDGVEQHPR